MLGLKLILALIWITNANNNIWQNLSDSGTKYTTGLIWTNDDTGLPICIKKPRIFTMSLTIFRV